MGFKLFAEGFDPNETAAAESAHELFRFGLLDWKVLPELQNTANFDSATEFITVDDVRENFACGPDVEKHVEVARPFVEAGLEEPLRAL